MTMQINIKDQFMDQFQAFVNSLPKNAIEVNNVNDNSYNGLICQDTLSKNLFPICTCYFKPHF